MFWTRKAVLGAGAAKSCELMPAPQQGSDLIAAAARTLALMRTYIKTVLPPAERGKVFHTLAKLPIERLAEMNPVQAEHETERAIEASRHPQADAAISSCVCASRGSALALIQARTVAAKLARPGSRRKYSTSPRPEIGCRTVRSSRSAPKACSSKNWSSRCETAARTMPCIHAKICRARYRATCVSPLFRRAKTRATHFAASATNRSQPCRRALASARRVCADGHNSLPCARIFTMSTSVETSTLGCASCAKGSTTRSFWPRPA